MRHAIVTAEQAADSKASMPMVWPDLGALGVTPLRYDGLHMIAPGIVLIKAPGHTPGSQMVYVRLNNGREYIFMGDAASLAENVRRLAIRSRYVTSGRGAPTHDDRPQVAAETRRLHALQAANPQLILVPGHDGATFERFIAQGQMMRGFSVSPTSR